MSIDKIKKRINQIEESDFRMDELYNNLTSDQLNTLAMMSPNKRQGNKWNPKDNGIMGNINKSDMHSEKISNLAQDHFANSSQYGVDRPSININGKFEGLLRGIYTILRDNNALPREIDKDTLKPVKAYVAKYKVSTDDPDDTHPQSTYGTVPKPNYITNTTGTGNPNYMVEVHNPDNYIIESADHGEVEIIFDNENQDNLLQMNVYLGRYVERQNIQKSVDGIRKVNTVMDVHQPKTRTLIITFR